MRVILNCINMVSAGTLVVAKSFINALKDIENSQYGFLIWVPSDFGFEDLDYTDNMEVTYFPRQKHHYAWRLWFDFFKVPELVENCCADLYVALGNHAPAKLPVPKIVLFHHPHYTNWKDYKLSMRRQLLNFAERRIFSLTVRSCDKIVVQLEYFQQQMMDVWQVEPERIAVIPNGLAQSLINTENETCSIKASSAPFKILYVSRFYQHKNHDFLLEIAQHLAVMHVQEIQFVVTLDLSIPGANAFWQRITDKGLEQYFLNIGEIPQSELKYWYLNSDLLIFPSMMETFGNALLEAMSYGLPTLAIKLPYAQSVCDDAALYFDKDNPSSAVNLIVQLKDNASIREQLKTGSLRRYKNFPEWNEIARRYLQLGEELVSKKSRLN